MADVPRKDMDIEDLLRRADFSRETDFKERLWKRLTEQMEQESLIVDLDDDDLAQAAGGLNWGGAANPSAKKIGF